MEYRWIEDVEEFCGIAERWDRAIAASGDHNPFLLSDFILTWWKHYSRNRKLMILVASDGDRITGGIPLCLEKRFGRRVLVHIGGSAANLTHYFSVDNDPGLVVQLVESLSKRGDWDRLLLTRVRTDSALMRHIKSVPWDIYGGLEHSDRDNGFNGIIDVAAGYDPIFKNLNNRLRKYLKNGLRESDALGGASLVRVNGVSDVGKLFEQYVKLSVASFNSRGRRSAFEDSRYRDFFKDILCVFEAKGMLDSHKLSAGEKTLAISFGYRFGEGFKWILTAYSQEFSSLRPGHILIDFLVREAIAKGDTYFDMYYGGESFYKKQWCNKMVPLKSVEIFRSNMINRAIVHTERLIRSNQQFLKTARKMRDMLSAGRVAGSRGV